MFSDTDLNSIVTLLGDRTASLIYRPGNESSPYSDALLAAARQVETGTSGRISVKENTDMPPFGQTCLSIGENIHYLAVPGGREIPPFAELVSGNVDVKGDGSTADLTSAELIVFVASECPHCPNAVRAASRLALVNHQIQCIVVDVQHNPELAMRFSVKSIPLTLLDRRLSWTGVVPSSAIADKIRSRGTAAHEVDVLSAFIESGRLDDAGAQVLQENGASSFVELWTQSTLATRIGLMMVAEAVLDTQPKVFDPFVKKLSAITKSEDAALRGDTADLLGQIGHPDALPFLTNLIDDPNPDVAEIAQEALDGIKEEITK